MIVRERSSQGISEIDRPRFLEAARKISQRDYTGAEKILKRLIRNGNRSAIIYEALAASYWDRNKVNAAIEALYEGIESASSELRLWDLIGNCYFEIGHFEVATRIDQEVVSELSPLDSISMERLVKTCFALGWLADAGRIFAQLPNVRIEDYSSISEAIIAYYGRGIFDPDLYRNLARYMFDLVEREEGELTEMSVRFLAELEALPAYEDEIIQGTIQLLKAVQYVFLRRPEEAIESLRGLFSLNPQAEDIALIVNRESFFTRDSWLESERILRWNQYYHSLLLLQRIYASGALPDWDYWSAVFEKLLAFPLEQPEEILCRTCALETALMRNEWERGLLHAHWILERDPEHLIAQSGKIGCEIMLRRVNQATVDLARKAYRQNRKIFDLWRNYLTCLYEVESHRLICNEIQHLWSYANSTPGEDLKMVFPFFLFAAEMENRFEIHTKLLDRFPEEIAEVLTATEFPFWMFEIYAALGKGDEMGAPRRLAQVREEVGSDPQAQRWIERVEQKILENIRPLEESVEKDKAETPPPESMSLEEFKAFLQRRRPLKHRLLRDWLVEKGGAAIEDHQAWMTRTEFWEEYYLELATTKTDVPFIPGTMQNPYWLLAEWGIESFEYSITAEGPMVKIYLDDGRFYMQAVGKLYLFYEDPSIFLSTVLLMGFALTQDSRELFLHEEDPYKKYADFLLAPEFRGLSHAQLITRLIKIPATANEERYETILNRLTVREWEYSPTPSHIDELRRILLWADIDKSFYSEREWSEINVGRYTDSPVARLLQAIRFRFTGQAGGMVRDLSCQIDFYFDDIVIGTSLSSDGYLALQDNQRGVSNIVLIEMLHEIALRILSWRMIPQVHEEIEAGHSFEYTSQRLITRVVYPRETVERIVDIYTEDRPRKWRIVGQFDPNGFYTEVDVAEGRGNEDQTVVIYRLIENPHELIDIPRVFRLSYTPPYRRKFPICYDQQGMPYSPRPSTERVQAYIDKFMEGGEKPSDDPYHLTVEAPVTPENSTGLDFGREGYWARTEDDKDMVRIIRYRNWIDESIRLLCFTNPFS